MTIEAMFGKKDQQSDGAYDGQGKQDLLPFDGVALQLAQFGVILVYDIVQFDGHQHMKERAYHEGHKDLLVNC